MFGSMAILLLTINEPLEVIMNTLPTVYFEYLDSGNKVVVDNLDTALALIDAAQASLEDATYENPERDWKVQS